MLDRFFFAQISDNIFLQDGRRAPGPDLCRGSSTRSIDTQTPSGYVDEGATSSSGSRSHSVSPALPIMPAGPMDNSRPSSAGDSLDVCTAVKEAEVKVEEKGTWRFNNFNQCLIFFYLNLNNAQFKHSSSPAMPLENLKFTFFSYVFSTESNIHDINVSIDFYLFFDCLCVACQQVVIVKCPRSPLMSAYSLRQLVPCPISLVLSSANLQTGVNGSRPSMKKSKHKKREIRFTITCLRCT